MCSDRIKKRFSMRRVLGLEAKEDQVITRPKETMEQIRPREERTVRIQDPNFVFYSNTRSRNLGSTTGSILMPALPEHEAKKPELHKIIIGVDYGTTFTGISYVPTSPKNAEVNVIRTWPGPGGSAVWKVPSTIAYASENEDTITDGQERWGYNVTPKMTSYSWTKLLLDRADAPTAFDDQDLFKIEGTGCLALPATKGATEVSANFLRNVYKFTLETLEKRLGADVVRVTPFEFWFTVPAIWSDAAKSATINAAKAAGFGSRRGDVIQLIPEPEAAAMATVRDRSTKGSMGPIQPGHNVLICDCGGGTVDITTYSVKRTSPLEFDELVIGTGAKCGSTYIDREFHRWMAQKFGNHFTYLPLDKKGPRSKFMNEFEAYKHDFGSSADLERVYEIPLVMRGYEDSEFYDYDESIVKIRGHEMRQFFQPAVTSITGLLTEQFEEATARGQRIDHIILVGGFGDSNYLFRAVQDLCRQRNMPLPVCPEHPQAAIVKGAAIRGLETKGRPARICRKHYGFGVSFPFREGTDAELDAYINKWREQKYCRGRVDWQIEKRQPLTRDTHMSSSVDKTCYYRGAHTSTIKLYCCGLEQAPDYKTDEGVELVGEVEYTLQDSDFDSFKTKVINGKQAWLLERQIEVSLGGEDSMLRFRVTREGRELGSTTIRYAH